MKDSTGAPNEERPECPPHRVFRVRTWLPTSHAKAIATSSSPVRSSDHST